MVHTSVKSDDSNIVEIVDLKSTNGTFLNGAERVSSEAGRRTRLQHGDLVTLGSTGTDLPQSRASSRRSRRKPRVSDVVYRLVLPGGGALANSGKMMRLFERAESGGGRSGEKRREGGGGEARFCGRRASSLV